MSKKILSSKMGRRVGAVCVMLSLGAAMAAQAAEVDTTFAIVSGHKQLDDESSYWQSAEVGEGAGSATVTVNESQKKQSFRGFAGTFNEAGWEMLTMLDEKERKRAMRLLFSKDSGLGLEWGRIPIGSSDYGLSRYSLCDATSDDLTMSKFSVARDKDTLMQYIKWALEYNPDIKFWASPWTPPPWMKENTISDPRSKGYDGGLMRNDAGVFDAYALYFSKFIKAYDAEGIKISAVCPQNEPGYLREYPTCSWGQYDGHDGSTDYSTKEYLSTFVADHLYPKLAADNQGTEIWFGTLSNDKSFDAYWSGMKQKLGSKAHEVIKGLGFQWNNVGKVATNSSDGYFVFCSEHQCGNYYWESGKATSREDADVTKYLDGLAPNNYNYGVESWGLISKWIKEGTHLYSAWNMVLDEKGFNLNWKLQWPQNSLLFVNRSTKKLVATPYYYVMRHIGQYVDSGAVLLGTQGDDALAFKNPNGSFVVAIANPGAAKDMTVSVGGKSIKFRHPGKGWATLYTGPKSTAVKGLVNNKVTQNTGGLKVTSHADGYRIDLPSREAGRVELMTLSGQVLESKAIVQGSHSIQLQKQSASTGMLLVRVSCGNDVRVARIMNAR